MTKLKLRVVKGLPLKAPQLVDVRTQTPGHLNPHQWVQVSSVGEEPSTVWVASPPGLLLEAESQILQFCVDVTFLSIH